MIKRIVLLLLAAGSALAASAASITFQPTSQTINLGSTTKVDVYASGLTRGQVLGAFDLLINNDSSIVKPLGVTFFSNLGSDLSFSGSAFTNGSANAFEVSNVDNATLLGLQGSQPFALFELTYLATGVGTSQLTLGITPDVLSDGNGNLLATPTVGPGSITVVGGVATTPEPSSLLLLGTGIAGLATARRRRAQ